MPTATTKSAIMQARVEPQVKAQATDILQTIGLNTSDAFNMFLRQVIMHNGLPFEAKVPNAELRAALNTPKSEMETFSSVKEMRAHLNAL